MATIDKEQLEIATKLAALMDRMAITSSKIDNAQLAQVESMKQIASVINTLDARETISQLNEVSTNVKNIVDKMGELAKVQEQTLEQMGKKASEAGGSVNVLTQKMRETQSAVNDVNKTKLDGLLTALETPGGASRLLTKNIKNLGEYLSKKFPTSWIVASAAVTGFYQGLQNMLAISKGVLGFLTGTVDALVNVGGAILAIPFKMFNGLVDIANKAGNGSTELMQAIENIRKEFGALNQSGPQTIKSLSTEMKGFSDTGLSAFRIFGNMAQRLETFLKLAQSMGPLFEELSSEFKKNGGAILAWQKGLGLTDEQLRTIGERAKTFGRTMTDDLMDIQKLSQGLGKDFGISGKIISRSMVKAAADVKHFGGVTNKAIAEAVVYTHKLGVELEKVTGVLDSFDTFDNAAENASKLSQAFGLNVDAMKMMEAATPADAIDQLRKSFAAAGKDASTMDRYQLRLLASSTGLDEATARQVFSLKNQGKSMEEIRKSGEKAQKQELSQAQAMSKLADSIERLVHSAGSHDGGFFDRFFHGFLGGIQASQEFRGIIMHIQQALRLVEMAGVRLGRTLVQIFPGVKTFLGGISDFFNPKKFGSLFNGITDELIVFFKGFSKGEYSLSELMDNLKKKFFNFFDKSDGSGKKILDGFKTFMGSISKIMGEAIKLISDKVKDVIVWTTDVITGKIRLDAPSASGPLGFLGELLLPIIEGLKHAWTVLAPAMWDLLSVLADKALTFLKNTVLPKLTPFIPYMASILFGPALTRSILSTLTISLGKGMLSGAGSIIKGLSGKFADAASSIKAAPSGPNANPLPGQSAMQEAVASAKTMDKGGSGISWAKVGMFLVGLAGVITIGMAAVFGSIAVIRKYNITGEEVIKSLSILGAVALATLPVAASLFVMSKVPLDPTQTAVGVLAIGLSVAAMAATLGLIYVAMKNAPLDKLMAISKILWEMSKVFVAASIVVAGATAIGSFIVGTSGIGAGIIAAGMGALMAAISAMSSTVISIMKQLNDVPMSSEFKDKVDAFTKIMDAITNFSKNFSTILEAVKPSWLTLISGKDDTVERIQKVKEMIDSMIGKSAGNGLIGIIEKIIWAVKQMSGGDSRLLEGAKSIADILNAMGTMASAMTAPDAMFKSIDSMWSSASDVNQAIRLTTTYAEKIAKNVEGLIKVFVEKVMPIVQGSGQGLNDQQIKGAAAVGQLLGAVVQISQGMQPSQTTITALRDVSSNIIASGEDSSLNPENMSALGAYVKQISEGLTKVLPVVINSINPLLQTLGNWHFSDSDTKALGFVGPLLQQLFVMVQSITAQSSQLTQAKIPGVDVADFVNKIGETVPKIFDAINQKLPTLFDSLKSSIQNIQKGINPSTLKQNLDVFKSLMDVVSSVPSIISSMTGTNSKSLDVKSATENMKSAFEGLTALLKNGDEISVTAKTITTGGITAGLTAISSMVDKANKLNTALGNLPDMKLDAKLKTLATGLGIGGKFNYEIKSKDVVIHVQFNVEMNAADLEKSLVLRDKSIIKSRLNYALGQDAGKPAREVDQLPNKPTGIVTESPQPR